VVELTTSLLLVLVLVLTGALTSSMWSNRLSTVWSRSDEGSPSLSESRYFRSCCMRKSEASGKSSSSTAGLLFRGAAVVVAVGRKTGCGDV
jgi:hypothetical protein